MGDRILSVAKACGAEAIHPGYGFLSENAAFSRACATAGLIFIGPPPSAIEAMGSKSASKAIMTEAGVPVVPGYWGEEQTAERLKAEAEKVGYPVMMKAWMGGGGKGMRIIHSPDEFDEKLEACRREAKGSFGDDRVLLERYITRPRHIEFQVFCDTQGGAVHLFERDCSVQRRHQKVLEEAPAPGMTPALRAEMGRAAVNAALAVGYVGVGTVEFIFDAGGGGKGDYFFMEMNTRLQVEHPVTEMVVRRDLVQWQLHVAAGHRLPAGQAEVAAIGHAVEARVYAENPASGFLPAAGRVRYLRQPPLSPVVRVESAVREGDAIGVWYDPMVSKVVAWGETRDRALERMEAALRGYEVAGVVTNIAFLLRCVTHPAFRAGQVETGFIAEHLAELIPAQATGAEADTAVCIAALGLLLRGNGGRERGGSGGGGGWTSSWARGGQLASDAAGGAGGCGCSGWRTTRGGQLTREAVDLSVVHHAEAGHYAVRVGEGGGGGGEGALEWKGGEGGGGATLVAQVGGRGVQGDGGSGGGGRGGADGGRVGARGALAVRGAAGGVQEGGQGVRARDVWRRWRGGW